MPVGSIRGFSVEGIPYDVAGDANFNRKPTGVENTGVPTSGETMLKQTKIVPTLEGATLIVTENELVTLTSFADSTNDRLKISYTDASNNVLRCNGKIQLEGYESEEGRLAVIVIPKTAWTPFLA